jgi:hypothetical protein
LLKNSFLYLTERMVFYDKRDLYDCSNSSQTNLRAFILLKVKKSTNTKDDKIVYILERGRSQETSLSGVVTLQRLASFPDNRCQDLLRLFAIAVSRIIRLVCHFEE